MKKRTAFVGTILSLIPFGQPLIIKTSVVLYSSAVMLFVPEKVNADTAEFFLEKGIREWLEGDDYAAISSYSKAIKLKPSFTNAYIARCGSFVNINRSKDAIKDCNKAISLGNFDSSVYRNLCGAHAQLEEYKIAEGFVTKRLN